MATSGVGTVCELITSREPELLDAWVSAQLSDPALRRDLLTEGELRGQSADFLRRFREALQGRHPEDVQGGDWDGVREMLGTLSRSRAMQGFSPSETATFVFSLKRPLFAGLRERLDDRGRWRTTSGPPPSCSTSWVSTPPRSSSAAARRSSSASSRRCWSSRPPS